MTQPSAKPLQSKLQQLHEDILIKTERFMSGDPLPEPIRKAFLETPRHAFIPRFPNGQPGLWSEASDEQLLQHLDILYADRPYCIYQDDKGSVVSTISQPSLVLYMLSLLELEPGMSLFELGAGSGWNAALMGRIVGEKGNVYSIEVEPALVPNARQALERQGISNVSIMQGDASRGLSEQAPFDRGVFTASSWDLPAVFFDQIKESGLLLFVFAYNDSLDILAVLRKTANRFSSELLIPCRFVPVADSNRNPSRSEQSVSEKTFHRWMRENALEPEDMDLQIYPARDAPSTPSLQSHRYQRGHSLFEWTPLGDAMPDADLLDTF